MRIALNGQLADERRVRVGFIGCGSHAFRNVFPAFQFTPIELVATCDLQLDRARAYARQFGAADAYDDPERMLSRDDIDAVFIVTNYDERMRPRYPQLAARAMAAGKHVWMEKPPAATLADVDLMRDAAQKHRRHAMVGFKKMFAPANRKAKSLASGADFGQLSMITMQYPQYVPEPGDIKRYLAGEPVGTARDFLDHLCHPMSLLLMLNGMPRDLVYQRSRFGAGALTFTYADGVVASMAFTHGMANDGGMERTMLVSDRGRHITVENNTRVTYRRTPPNLGYGTSPDYFQGDPDQASNIWEPEVSLGQLYNKAMFLLGYYAEVQAFAECVLNDQAPTLGSLEHARQVTRVFEAFASPPGQVITL
ncbi:MAG TPA: Gfo/Idh/MocA family oxidoreductase [Tepidisphaeraceae bacterium]|jgi:predicted dehydrogenase|nr:Gfo/Idh/MocA family oxidoreductase [Tepidisphaeraceae bacterium]